MLSDEQMELRCGKLTASSIHKIMGAKGFGKTGESYLWQVIAERETGKTTETPTTYAMQWGNEHEEEAGAYYEQAKGITIEKGESISFNELVVTPDYTFVSDSDSYGIEIKCPYNSANQSERLRYNDYKDIIKNNPDYYWQMVAGMLATGFRKWVFLSYDPRMINPENRMVAITVPYIEKDYHLLKSRISQAIDFMISKGIKDIDHDHAEFYEILNKKSTPINKHIEDDYIPDDFDQTDHLHDVGE